MDLTESIAPKSDQINAEDLLTGPRTFTVEKVSAGSIEQPVDVHLIEFPGRPYRPSKSMRRIMVAAWGKEASEYAGRRLTLYRDPEVRFGGSPVGGIKISHLSHLETRLTLALTVTRGKRAPYVVDPLVDDPRARPEPATEPEPLTARTRGQLFALLTEHGITDPAQQRAGMERILGRPIASRGGLTEDDARAVILDLQSRTIPGGDAAGAADDEQPGGAA